MRSRRFAPPLDLSALGKEPLGFLKGALGNCADRSDHDCETPGYVPTSLVDVRNECLRIVELTMSSPDRRYLALSYCWGGQSQLELTRESEQRLQAGFSVEELSPTQRDTVALAKALSVPYVWIDALCICQQDREDWEAESATMGSVFGGALFTACAALSFSCQEGYLQRNFVTPITIPAYPPVGSVWIKGHLFLPAHRVAFSLCQN